MSEAPEPSSLRSPPRRVSLHLWIARHALAFSAAFAAIVLGAAIVAASVTSIVAKRFEGRRWSVPSRIYSDMTVVRPGDTMSLETLADRLDHRLYRRQTDAPQRPGRYRLGEGTIEVYTRDFRYPGRFFHGALARVEIAGGRVKTIFGDSGEPLPALVLEPERIGAVFGEDFEDRTPISLEEVPESLRDAVLVTEDRDFYRHQGVSVKRTFGALLANFSGGSVQQGGSTLTQQLVKNLYLTPKKTIRRKLVEAVMAVVLDARYPKDEIFAAYLNEIYLGQRGSIAVTGVGEAARFYFGKDVSDLDLAESATLAGMIKAPNAYSPFKNPEKTRARRDLVLRMLAQEERITPEQLAAALAEPLSPRTTRREYTAAPHFVDFVKAQLAEAYGEKLRSEGLQIFTTLDVDLQQAAQRSVTDGLAALEKKYSRLARASAEGPLQGALIAVEPQTGAVRALVGGRDYGLSQFNRVTQARRQPGSLFKPFVYLAAFARRDLTPPVTPATILEDTPISIFWDERQEHQQWTPRNYDVSFRGPMSARRALELSINVPTVRVSLAAGLPTVIAAARAAGIGSRLRPYPALALGAFEISPMEIASAFSVFANSGVRVEANSIVGVMTGEGEVLTRKDVPLSPALPADAVFLANSLMRGAVDRGTATGARAGGVRGCLAGKTGTTNDGRDAWFVGFSPRFLAAVWVGYDDNRGLHLSGTEAAVPIFATFSKSVPVSAFAECFPVPSNVVTAEIDPETGGLATEVCPKRLTEVFISGTEPTHACTVHGGLLDLVGSVTP
ncbi:MAG TPA: PBP1A family penicillin-binding protein [Thermoanaerobaculia bacterium]